MGAVPDLLWPQYTFFDLDAACNSKLLSCECAGVESATGMESKKMAAAGSTMLGYQSADDFFDVNALMVEANDLFPAGSVQIQGMKVFSPAQQWTMC